MVDKKVQRTLEQIAEVATKKGMTADDWQNAITGLGDPMRDKRYGAVPYVTSLGYEDLTDIYRASKTAQIAVDVYADEMTREWLDVVVPEDEEMAEAVSKDLERLTVQSHVHQMQRWQRLYGGSALLVGVNDGQTDFSQPIDEKNLRSIDFLTPFDPSECRVIEWQASPASQDYGQPLYYSIFPRIFGMGAATILQRVHASRVIRLNGPLANRWQVAIRAGWGDSIFDTTWDKIRDFDGSHAGAAHLLTDWSQGVYKITGLADAMAADNEKLVVKRLQMMDYSRSLLRSVALDATEDFKRESTPASGLPDLLDRVAKYMAMQLQMPVTVLMGESPAGLNATGDNEVKMWFNVLKAKQARELSPILYKLIRLVMLAKQGPAKGAFVDGTKVEWRDLGQPSQKEEAETHFAQAQADNLNIQNGIVAPDEVRVSRFKGGKFSTETALDESLDVIPDESLLGAESIAEGDKASAGAVSQPVVAGAALSGKMAGSKTQTPPSNGDKVASLKGQSTTQGPPQNAVAQPTPNPGARQNLNAPRGATPSAKTDQGMAGHQVSAAHEIVKSAATGQIPVDAVEAMLTEMLGLPPETAQKIVGSLKGFKPKVDPIKMAEAKAKGQGLNNYKNKAGKANPKKGNGQG